MVDDTGTFAEACRLLADWNDDYVTAALPAEDQGRAGSTRSTDENRLVASRPPRWVLADDAVTRERLRTGRRPCPRFDVVDRLQVFVAPGVMLMRVPTPTGEQELQPATDWGVSYKLFNFNLPGVQRQGTLHVNLVRAWVFMRVGSIGGNTTVNLAGFSVTLK